MSAEQNTFRERFFDGRNVPFIKTFMSIAGLLSCEKVSSPTITTVTDWMRETESASIDRIKVEPGRFVGKEFELDNIPVGKSYLRLFLSVFQFPSLITHSFLCPDNVAEDSLPAEMVDLRTATMRKYLWNYSPQILSSGTFPQDLDPSVDCTARTISFLSKFGKIPFATCRLLVPNGTELTSVFNDGPLLSDEEQEIMKKFRPIVVERFLPTTRDYFKKQVAKLYPDKNDRPRFINAMVNSEFIFNLARELSMYRLQILIAASSILLGHQVLFFDTDRRFLSRLASLYGTKIMDATHRSNLQDIKTSNKPASIVTGALDTDILDTSTSPISLKPDRIYRAFLSIPLAKINYGRRFFDNFINQVGVVLDS